MNLAERSIRNLPNESATPLDRVTLIIETNSIQYESYWELSQQRITMIKAQSFPIMSKKQLHNYWLSDSLINSNKANFIFIN